MQPQDLLPQMAVLKWQLTALGLLIQDRSNLCSARKIDNFNVQDRSVPKLQASKTREQ
jgi:hypothetical protein